jgi:hypothetical protein
MSDENVLDIIKDDGLFVYINKEDATPANLIGLKQYLAPTPAKKIKDIKDGVIYRILSMPNRKTGISFLCLRRSANAPKLNKAVLRRAILSLRTPTVAEVARIVDCPYVTTQRYIDKYNLKPLIERVRTQAIDFVEDKLVALAQEGNVPAIKLYLEAKGKDRGYGGGEKAVNTDLSVKIVFEDPKEISKVSFDKQND